MRKRGEKYFLSTGFSTGFFFTILLPDCAIFKTLEVTYILYLDYISFVTYVLSYIVEIAMVWRRVSDKPFSRVYDESSVATKETAVLMH